MDILTKAIQQAKVDTPVYAHTVEGGSVTLHLPWGPLVVSVTEPGPPDTSKEEAQQTPDAKKPQQSARKRGDPHE